MRIRIDDASSVRGLFVGHHAAVPVGVGIPCCDLPGHHEARNPAVPGLSISLRLGITRSHQK